jgi:predicted MFS family arabinose efflux permease
MNKKSFYIFCAAFLATSFGVATIAPLVPQIAAQMHVDPLFMAHLSWWYMLPYGVSALLWAPLTRALTVRTIFNFTTIAFSLAVLFFSQSRTAGQAFLGQALIGIFSSSFMPLALIVIGREVAPREKGKHVGILFGLAYVSSFIGVTLSGFLPWRMVYLVPAIIGLLTFIFSFYHLEKFDFRQKGLEFTYHKTCCEKQAVLLFIFIFLASFSYHSLQQLLGVYLNQTFDVKQSVLSAIFVVATSCSIIFQFGGGMLTKKFNNIKIARVGFFLLSVFAGLLLTVNDHRWMFLLMAVWGTGWALNHIGLSSYLTHLPDKILRDAASLNSSIRFVSGGLGVLSASAIIEKFGFKTHFIFVAITTMILGLFVDRALKS